jgi:hypothetical protein
MMNQENRMRSCADILQTNEIETFEDDLKIKANTTIIDGNLKINGILEEKNKREIIFDEQIDISSESNQDIKAGIPIDFKPLENEFLYKMLVIINDGEFVNITHFIYKKSIRTLGQFTNCSKFLVSLSMSYGKLLIKFKSRNNVDMKNAIHSVRVKITIY